MPVTARRPSGACLVRHLSDAGRWIRAASDSRNDSATSSGWPNGTCRRSRRTVGLNHRARRVPPTLFRPIRSVA
jgi:hypothetical protein